MGIARTQDSVRLLGGLRADGAPVRLAEHLQWHGPATGCRLDVVTASGLRGRGGAGFPVAEKMRAVMRTRGRPVVVANGAAVDPLSEKDAFLLAEVPHLVLDGAQVAADIVKADRVHVYAADLPDVLDALRGAIAERARDRTDRVPVTLTTAPDGYVAGEASAAVHHLSGGLALPTFRPPRMALRGVRRRPTLVQNVETLANLALIARHGADWFRSAGTAEEPGTMVITVNGVGPEPSVLELPIGSTVAEALRMSRSWVEEPPAAVLVGGTSGRWLAASDALPAPLSHDGLAGVGGALGTAALLVLGHHECGLVETARLARFLAAESSGQCGPCVNGLPAIASTVSALAAGEADELALQRLERWCSSVPGRGACRHPDETAALVASALSVFAEDVDRHLDGQCARRPAVRSR